jgi:rRNA-processing protein FCF1
VKYVVDTNIFNHLLDGRLTPSALPCAGAFVATNVQLRELEGTKDTVRRAALMSTFHHLAPELVHTESFALNIPGSGFDESKWSDVQQATSLKLKLDALNKCKRNNWHDAIIAEVALVNGYGLVTNDGDLAKVAEQHGIAVIYPEGQLEE